MILITTAGKVGSETARLLAQRQEPVRILVRDPEKAAALAQAGVEVVEGDLEVPATIDAAMQRVSSVVLVSAPMVQQELNVIESAVRTGASTSSRLRARPPRTRLSLAGATRPKSRTR